MDEFPENLEELQSELDALRGVIGAVDRVLDDAGVYHASRAMGVRTLVDALKRSESAQEELYAGLYRVMHLQPASARNPDAVDSAIALLEKYDPAKRARPSNTP